MDARSSAAAGKARNDMLFYREDKLLRSEFGLVWARVEELLQLATPGSRAARAVTIWDERDPRNRTETAVFATDDPAKQAEVDALYARARLVHQDEGFRVYVRWQPEFGPASIDFATYPVNHQLTLLQQFRPHLFLFFQLLTSYERHDDPEFLQFVDRAEKILRVKLLPKNWRHVVLADSGKPTYRKVDWGAAT